jgi:hypothetical protein
MVAAGLLLAALTSCQPYPVKGSLATADLAGRQEAELDVVSGADSVLVHAEDLGGALFHAWTPADSRAAVQADVHDGVVRVSLASAGGDHDADLTVELNTRVLWRIRLDGGANQETVAMEQGRLAELSLGAGSARIQANLPVPHGTVPIQMTSGASTFTLRLPPTIPTQVRFAAGAGQATIDGVVHTGLPGGTEFTPDNWTTATDRYLVDNTAGVSALTVERTT